MQRVDRSLLRVWGVIGMKGALLAGLAAGVLLARDPSMTVSGPLSVIPPFLRLVPLNVTELDSDGQRRLPDNLAETPVDPVQSELQIASRAETSGKARSRRDIQATQLKSGLTPDAMMAGLPDYDLALVKAGLSPAPRLSLSQVPDALNALDAGDARKDAFVAVVLPLVLQVNEEISQARSHVAALQRILDNGGSLPRAERHWLEGQFARYKVEYGDFPRLMRRLDVVPPSLALAQAAIESGWGSSRFAREGNALFGQWTWSASAPGIEPEDRAEGMTHRIRAFDSPLAAVRAYVRNLNTHPAYAGLRQLREVQHKTGGLDAHDLAEGLTAYSEKGAAYVDLVRDIIRANGLDAFDRVRLADAGSTF